MSVTGDILAVWRRPRATIRAKLDAGPREDRALAVLIGACGLAFVAQWPSLSRAAHLDPSVPLDARMGGALLGTVFLLPLFAYALAALTHLAARGLGGRGSYFGARLALFWAFLSVTPLMLLAGLVTGFLGPGAPSTLTGAAVFLGFLALWLTMLHEAETGAQVWS